LGLERGLEGVDGHENHPEEGGCDCCEDGLEEERQFGEERVGVEQGEDAYVGGGVAEAVRVMLMLT
jgi:hypothetical protein